LNTRAIGNLNLLKHVLELPRQRIGTETPYFSAGRSHCNTTDSGYGPVVKFSGTNEEFEKEWKSKTGYYVDFRGMFHVQSKKELETKWKRLKIEFEGEPENEIDCETKNGTEQLGWDFWINENDWGVGFYDKEKQISFGPVYYHIDNVTREELHQLWQKNFSDLDPRKVKFDELDRIFSKVVENLNSKNLKETILDALGEHNFDKFSNLLDNGEQLFKGEKIDYVAISDSYLYEKDPKFFKKFLESLFENFSLENFDEIVHDITRANSIYKNIFENFMKKPKIK